MIGLIILILTVFLFLISITFILSNKNKKTLIKDDNHNEDIKRMVNESKRGEEII